MPEIAPSHASLLAALRDPNAPQAAAPTSFETSFADLLQASGAVRDSGTAEAFAARNLVGRATLTPDKLQPIPLAIEPRPSFSPSDPSLQSPEQDTAASAPPAIGMAAGMATLLPAPVALVPTPSGLASASPIDRTTLLAPVAEGGPRLPGNQPGAETLPEEIPFRTLAASLTEGVNAPEQAVLAPLLTAEQSTAPDKQASQQDSAARPDRAPLPQARTVALILEQSQQQAQNSAVHVALLAVESGVRVIARVGGLSDTERARLKSLIGEVLAEHGLADAGSVITPATTQSRSNFQEE